MKRALALLAPVALVLGLAACGDDDDDPDTTAEVETDVTTPDITLPEITIPDITLPDISIPDISLPDISLPDLSDITLPDISIPDFSVPDNAEDLLRQVFPGLDDEQIDCLVENLGSDFDPQQALQLMGECDIAVSDLAGG